MGVQGIDTQTQLSRPLLLSCRIRLPCLDKVYTRALAEPGPTRLLPNHLGLPQTNELGQRTHTGRYRSSSHQEDCCLPHGTHTTNDRRQAPTVPSPTSCQQIEVTEELHAHSHAARLVCKQQQTAALERQPDRRAILRQNGTGGGRVFAGWIWRGLAVGEPLTDCAQGWAVRKQWWGDGAISTTPSRWIATAGSHRRWPTSSPAVY